MQNIKLLIWDLSWVLHVIYITLLSKCWAKDSLTVDYQPTVDLDILPIPSVIRKLPKPGEDEKLKLVMGVMSSNSNFLLRNATRNTWLKHGVFEYKFLIDRACEATSLEQEIFGDILFLNATYSGKAVRLAEKIYRGRFF